MSQNISVFLYISSWAKIVFNVDCVNVMEINVILFDLTTVGIPIRTTLDNSTTVQYAGLIVQLTAKARSTVRDIDPQVVKLETV